MKWGPEIMADVVLEKHYDNREVMIYSTRARSVTDFFHETANRIPEQEALVQDGKRFTYMQLKVEVSKVARELKETWGVAKGDRVALLLGNCPEFVVSMLAVAQIGGVSVPLNTRCSGSELEFMINNSGTKILISDPELMPTIETIRANLPAMEKIFVSGKEEFADCLLYNDLTNKPVTEDVIVPVDEEDLAVILYTSGTTGLPKGAMISHLGVCVNVISFSRALGTRTGDRTLVAVPLFHVTGYMFQTLQMFYVGGTVVIMRSYKTETMLELFDKERISFFIGVPTMYILMLLKPNLRDYNLSSLRILVNGGAILAEATIRQLVELIPHVVLHNSYGATETTGSSTIVSGSYMLSKASSVGIPFPVNEVIVADANGNSLAPEQIGEIWIKGPNVVKGYWQNPEATAREITNGFWHSGDIGKMDGEGFIYLMDRKKDMINRGGEKIFSVEIENVLYEHPKVQEVAVVGVPDEIFGEQVKAVVVPKPGMEITSEEVRDHVAKNLADFKVPKYVRIVTELPRNPGGKVMKAKLRILE